MPSLSLLSWNVQGGDPDDLATAINNILPDIVVLQEAPSSNTSKLDKALQTVLGYSFIPKLKEFTPLSYKVASSGKVIRIYPGDTCKTYYCMLKNGSNFTLNGFSLVDYTLEMDADQVKSGFDATSLGYDKRAPALVDLTYQGKNIHLYVWHAPVGHINKTCIQRFDNSDALDKSLQSADIVVIAGDLNNSDLSKAFVKFSGLQQKFDYILVAGKLKKLTVDDGYNAYKLYMEPLVGDAHSAVLGLVSW